MLTREQLQVLFHVHRFFTKIGFFPCSMDFKTGELSAQQSRSRWRLWWFFLSLVVCRAFLGTLRCIAAFFSPERAPPDEVPLMINQLVFWAAVYAFPMLFYKNLDITIAVFNSLLQVPVRKTTWRNITLQELAVLLVLPADVFVIAGAYIAVLALQPTAIYNFFSALNPSWQTVPVLIAIVLTDGFITFYIFAMLTILAHIMLLFFQKCIEETQNMLKTIGHRGVQNESLSAVTIQRTLKNLRHLQLLVLGYNVGYRHMHFVIKCIVLFWVITFIAFGMLSVHSNPVIFYSGLIFGTQFAIIYCTIFHKAFAIPMLTKKVKSKLSNFVKTTTNGVDRRVYEKCIRSIPPIGIKVGSFHSFERMSTPNFLAFALKNITRIVIGYRSK